MVSLSHHFERIANSSQAVAISSSAARDVEHFRQCVGLQVGGACLLLKLVSLLHFHERFTDPPQTIGLSSCIFALIVCAGG